uniref:methyltransferase domain-containing protein n=1 Tax=Cyanobium sp. TaxID=2164130 RepID=UPI004047A615
MYISHCALCNDASLYNYGDLIVSPLANNLQHNSALSATQPKFPLGLSRCCNCNHVQLSFAVPPEELFSDYSYQTGVSSAFRSHFNDLASLLNSKLGHLNSDQRNVLDIGCNDGILLDAFATLGWNTYGVDPASNLLQQISSRHTTFNLFFDQDTARIVSNVPLFSLITANNVFAHTRNLSGFASGVASLLLDDGLFVAEVQYLLPLLEGCLFDMIYHEHTSYHHLSPLVSQLPLYGLHVIDAEIINTHGGSLRIYCSKHLDVLSPRAKLILERERLFLKESIDSLVLSFYQTTIDRLANLSIVLDDFTSKKTLIWGFTAPAKATTLISGLSSTARDSILFVVDDSLLKQGCFIPGTHIPIVASSQINSLLADAILSNNPSIVNPDVPDVGIIFAWNISSSLLERLSLTDWGSGNYLVPLPEPLSQKVR